MQRRILVYRIGSLGDTLIALPAFHAIRQHFPGAFIALLNNAHEDRKRVMAQSVLPSEGLFDGWLTYPTGFSGTASFKEQIRLLFELRRLKFDTLVYLAPRLRTAKQVTRDKVFFYMAGIRAFHGFDGLPAPLPEKREGEPLPLIEHEADHLLYRLKLSGINVPKQGSIDLQLTEEEHLQARKWLEENCGEALDQKRLVAIAPGSKWSSKIWPEENFGQIGERLISELNLYPVIFGGREDNLRGTRLIARWKRGANAAGKLNVRHAAAGLSQCRLFVGNDTGTMHLAAAVGTPCIVAFAAQDWPGRWYPYGKGHIILREAVPCEGCMLRVCDKENLCLTSIKVDKVFEACCEVLKKRIS